MEKLARKRNWRPLKVGIKNFNKLALLEKICKASKVQHIPNIKTYSRLSRIPGKKFSNNLYK